MAFNFNAIAEVLREQELSSVKFEPQGLVKDFLEVGGKIIPLSDGTKPDSLFKVQLVNVKKNIRTEAFCEVELARMLCNGERVLGDLTALPLVLTETRETKRPILKIVIDTNVDRAGYEYKATDDAKVRKTERPARNLDHLITFS